MGCTWAEESMILMNSCKYCNLARAFSHSSSLLLPYYFDEVNVQLMREIRGSAHTLLKDQENGRIATAKPMPMLNDINRSSHYYICQI